MKKNYSILLFFILFHQFFIAQVPPDTIDDFDTVEINTRLDVPVPGILSNDTDQDNNSLFVVSFSVGANTVSAGQTISFSQGTITINANGSFTFIPATGYVGDVSTITYCISDGVFTSCANIYLTVVPIAGFLDISVLSSCNQGYTESNEYKISYNISLTNRSTARDYHPTSLIRNIDLINDLDAVFGTGCITSIENVSIATSDTNDFEGNPYPSDFGDSAINDNFLNFTSNSIFNNNAMNNFILYPRQSIDIQFCVIVNPFCNGRPEPTRSGSGINFDNIIDVNSSVGSDTANLLLTDFHTSEAVLAAGLFITNDPPANPNGTYDYVNTVIITNEGI